MSSETLGGYRLVRKLGDGARAEVHLGYPDATNSPPAAIKHYRPGVPQQSVITEIEALSRAWGDHVVELLDLATGADGAPALLLQRLPGGSLARLLQERSSIGFGEAITILAPLASTVSRMHAAGVAHGGLTAEAVLFDATGSPVLARFGRAELIAVGMSAAAMQAEARVAADLDGLHGVVSRVLGATHQDVAAAISEWFAVRMAEAPNLAADELANRLFAAALAEPVNFAEQPPSLAPLPNRIVTAEPVLHRATPAAVLLPEWVARYLPAAGWVARLRAMVGTVRPRWWAIAGAVAVALVAAVLLVPAGDSDATTQAAQPPVPSAAASASPASQPVTGDDPVEALLALLDVRARCIHDRSVLCLDNVGEQGSSALGVDQQQINELQSGGETAPDWNIDAVTLDERLGDSALVTVDDPADSEPASFLLVKGEAGWRIRDYLWQ